MSLWTSLLSWGLKTAQTEAQTVGLKALQDATGQLTNTLNTHAPDMAPALQPLMQQLISSAVAGIMTRTH